MIQIEPNSRNFTKISHKKTLLNKRRKKWKKWKGVKGIPLKLGWSSLSREHTYYLCLPCKTRYIVSLLTLAHPSIQHTASSPPNAHHICPHQWGQLSHYNLFLSRIGKGERNTYIKINLPKYNSELYSNVVRHKNEYFLLG